MDVQNCISIGDTFYIHFGGGFFTVDFYLFLHLLFVFCLFSCVILKCPNSLQTLLCSLKAKRTQVLDLDMKLTLFLRSMTIMK